MADYLLDTGVIVLALRGHPKVLDFLEMLSRKEANIFISAVTRLEVLAGMHPDEATSTLALLDAIACIPMDKTKADRAGRLLHEILRSRASLSVQDALISATALLGELTLVTLEPQRYTVPELRLQPLEL